MGKLKIKTTASSEAMRWADDGRVGDFAQEPGLEGNDFDVRMQFEPDGVVAANKIVGRLKERGVCLCQANAPQQLVVAAYEEAESLLEEGAFSPPLRVHDDRSMLEVPLWRQALHDEDKVYWVRDGKDGVDAKAKGHMTNALRVLSENIRDFGAGLGERLQSEMGISFDRLGLAMLSCYTGDRTYSLHLDNCHVGDDDREEDTFPDNGMRLTLVYYINLYWDPVERDNGGGLDVYLTDPAQPPDSAVAARGSKILRIAPHADTLALFLSDRMAHRVVATQGGKDPRFCLTMWCLDGEAMQSAARKLSAMRTAKQSADSDDGD